MIILPEHLRQYIKDIACVLMDYDDYDELYPCFNSDLDLEDICSVQWTLGNSKLNLGDDFVEIVVEIVNVYTRYFWNTDNEPLFIDSLRDLYFEKYKEYNKELSNILGVEI